MKWYFAGYLYRTPTLEHPVVGVQTHSVTLLRSERAQRASSSPFASLFPLLPAPCGGPTYKGQADRDYTSQGHQNIILKNK
jgi:hypothetical protein